MSKESGKKVIVVAGPTTVGKTKTAILLAQYFNTEIISFDSRQCFKELNIGVARPSAEELNLVPHHFIASHSIGEHITAAYFEKYALEKTEKLFHQYDTLIFVGGTGMYIGAFCDGLDDIPQIDANIKKNIIDNYKERGLQWLQSEIKKYDPEFYNRGEIKNPQRVMRALEVITGTGQSILTFRAGVKKKRDFTICKIGLDIPKEELHRNINIRVEGMINAGLEKEVKSLISYRDCNALQTVGYTEFFDYFDNKFSMEEAIDRIKIHTRQYAKRQITWFKKDKEYQWFHPLDLDKMIGYINRE